MKTITAKLIFIMPQVHSLKEKRMIARELIDKTRHKYKVSIAEVGTQDVHQTLTLGIAVVSGEYFHARKVMDEIIGYVERNAVAELISVEKEEY